MSSKEELIKKLNRLSQSSNIHEANSAKQKLMEIINKYNIDESILEEDRIEQRVFYFHNDMEKRLLHQIIYSVISDQTTYVPSSFRGKNIKLIANCTYSQFVEINVRYEFYKTLLYDDIDTLIRGFIYKHHIFPPDAKSIDSSEVSAEELDKYMRAQSMMSGMSNKKYIQRIGEPNEYIE